MMNLVSRCSERTPDVLPSAASESPENTKSDSQKVPLSSFNAQHTGTGKPVMLASSSNSSEWNNDDKWSSQVWKPGEMSKTCKDNTSKDPFSQCESLQGIRVQVKKISKWLQRQQLN